MEIEWLLYLGNATSKCLHAFPTDTGTYGDWSLCGRGSGSEKRRGIETDFVARQCGRCLEMLDHFSETDLEVRRIERLKEINTLRRVISWE